MKARQKGLRPPRNKQDAMIDGAMLGVIHGNLVGSVVMVIAGLLTGTLLLIGMGAVILIVAVAAWWRVFHFALFIKYMWE